MTPLEKAEFQGKANHGNVKVKQEKYTSQGVSLTHLQKVKIANEEQQMKIKSTTEQLINIAVLENSTQHILSIITFNIISLMLKGVE